MKDTILVILLVFALAGLCLAIGSIRFYPSNEIERSMGVVP